MSQTLRQEVNATVNATPSQILGPQMKRKALIISAPAVNPVSISFTGPGPYPKGLILRPGAQPIRIDIEDFADALTDPVYAVTSAGVEQIGILELFG